MNLLKAGTVLAAALACAACAVAPRLYKGPALPSSEEVVLTTEDPRDSGPRKLFLQYVDGESLYDVARRAMYRFPYPRSVHLKPGPHRIKVLYVSDERRATATLVFDSAAGRTYLIRAEPGAADAETRIWIEDIETGQRVDRDDRPEALPQ